MTIQIPPPPRLGVNRLVWAPGYHVNEVPGQSKGQCEWLEFGEFHIRLEESIQILCLQGEPAG